MDSSCSEPKDKENQITRPIEEEKCLTNNKNNNEGLL
jgi:hypothetical protein